MSVRLWCLSFSTARLILTHTVEWIRLFRRPNYPVRPDRDTVSGSLFNSLRCMESFISINMLFPSNDAEWKLDELWLCRKLHLCVSCVGGEAQIPSLSLLSCFAFFPHFSIISALFSSVLCLACCLVYRCFYFVTVCTFCVFNRATMFLCYPCSAWFFFVFCIMSDVLVQTSYSQPCFV